MDTFNGIFWVSYDHFEIDNMKTISFTKANNDLKAVLDNVCHSDNVVTVKRSNTDNAVIMSL